MTTSQSLGWIALVCGITIPILIALDAIAVQLKRIAAAFEQRNVDVFEQRNKKQQ